MKYIASLNAGLGLCLVARHFDLGMSVGLLLTSVGILLHIAEGTK